ncbi:MAG: DUF2029 domain-containing protein [Bacteroidota bacterium]|nr:DUF2029 domain-containing protein [Bacteroidota bacterium]
MFNIKKKFPWFDGYQWTWILYILVAIVCWRLMYVRQLDNNFKIFRESFYHLKDQLNMYAGYPKAYHDYYYYGPLFGVFVLPFALLPESAGLLLWEIVNALTLLVAVNLLPISTQRKMQLLLLCAICFANSEFSTQFNAMIAAMIIISFLLVEEGKDTWATLIIVVGALGKLYPVVGLAFFLFSRNKAKFAISTVIWFVVFLVLPVLFTSKAYILTSYHQWFAALSFKTHLNHQFIARSQDMCIMGVVRDLAHNPNIPDLPFLIFGAIIFAVPLLRFSQFKSYRFRLQVLANALIMVVIFSAGAESPTFIIAVAGIFLWMMIQEDPFTTRNIILIILLLVFTGLGVTDAMPMPFRRDVVGKYAITAWPCIAAWVIISYELLFKDFIAAQTSTAEKAVIAAGN